MFNFIYCFDQNYSKQGFTSILSLLDNAGEEISIYIISDVPENKLIIPNIISNHEKLFKLKIFQNNILDINFYNIQNSHVTEATFYRLFLEDFLKFDGFATYLDCDILCLSDPLPSISKVISSLEEKSYPVSFNTEIIRGEGFDYFEKLGMNGDKYFNAGVMIFNVQTWNKMNVKNKALKLIVDLKEKAIFWDQDILNVIFDENFLELPTELNSRSREDTTDESIIFHHFSGKFKPWSIRGIDQKYSVNFHNIYQKIYGREYLIVIQNLPNAFRQLKDQIQNKRISSDIKGLKILYHIFLAIIKKIFTR